VIGGDATRNPQPVLRSGHNWSAVLSGAATPRPRRHRFRAPV